MAGAPGARELFDTCSSSSSWLAPAGRHGAMGDAQVKIAVEAARGAATIVAMEGPKAEKRLRSFFIEAEFAVAGAPVGTCRFPAGAAVTMIDRAGTMFAASATSILLRATTCTSCTRARIGRKSSYCSGRQRRDDASSVGSPA